MSSYYDDDDELDIRVRHRASPVIFPEHRRPVARPVYQSHANSFLGVEGHGGGSLYRSRSTGHRPSPPPTAPVIINNRIYNENYESDEEEHYQLAPIRSPRSRSRSRPPSSSYSREDYELERARHQIEKLEIEAQIQKEKDQREKEKANREKDKKRMEKEMELYKLLEEKEMEEERKRIKKELELKRFLEEKEEKEEKDRIKKEADAAVEKFKKAEAERAAKEKKEKEEREKEYQRRLEEDLRKHGFDERQISVVTKKEPQIDPNRPTYTRMSRRHLSIETLRQYRVEYEFDMDPDYILIKRWVPEYEQEFLFNHTREIRESRRPVLLAIEGKKKKHHEPEFEFVRKKHERKPSPSPLLAYLAGSSRSYFAYSLLLTNNTHHFHITGEDIRF
ncbi:hypothetical protein B7494_g2214 [Chlorociboria aeruginascens]|nr:hypothetical protein B7494_g2214 [Chlorociboria aeruginascens]